jgi:predicted MarR family transcription regulator
MITLPAWLVWTGAALAAIGVLCLICAAFLVVYIIGVRQRDAQFDRIAAAFNEDEEELSSERERNE